MDEIFVPWRMEWVQRDHEHSDNCVFCRLAASTDETENRIVARSEHGYAVLNNAPYNPGHILVIPDDHVRVYTNLTPEVLTDVHTLLQFTNGALELSLHPEGYNVGMNIGKEGGASIEDHIHIHVVPRWAQDTTFMPTTANTKIIVEALDETYMRIRSAFAELQGTTSQDGEGAVMINH